MSRRTRESFTVLKYYAIEKKKKENRNLVKGNSFMTSKLNFIILRIKVLKKYTVMISEVLLLFTAEFITFFGFQ